MPHLSILDHLVCELDTAVRAIWPPQKRAARRPCPGPQNIPESLNTIEKRQVSGLMRVNHAGEVCAQALYQGQALTASLSHVKSQMAEAAAEEIDHLAWCEERLKSLGSQVSHLNPLWYGGSFLIGLLAGLAGDRWSLGFVAETERQVTAHLKKHLHLIPKHDQKTKAILKQMQEDEAHHAETALKAGGTELPWLIKQGMRYCSKLMTTSSYYL